MNKKVFLIIAVISVFIGIFAVKINNKPKNYEILFNWGTSENINYPKEVKKDLLIFGDVDFKKLDQLQLSTGKYINWFEPFYNYKNHTFETIENLFKARQKSDGYMSEGIEELIFDLYNKEDTKEIVQSVIDSNKKYKKIFNDIIELSKSSPYISNNLSYTL